MRFLNASETRAALTMSDAIEAMDVAFSSDSEMPLRTALGGSLIMPGRVGEVMAIKVVSTVPGNPAGLVTVFGPDGSPVGIVDGPTLTAIRTAAGAGLATKLLAGEGASVLAMLGAGAMAADQIEAVRTVRPIERVLIWSRSLDNARALADRIGGEAVAEPDAAVAVADVISCATPSTAPLFAAGSVKPGTHLNAVGAYTPEMVELPGELVRAAFVVVDDVEAAAAEAGDLIHAGKAPDATLGGLLDDGVPEIRSDYTVFKSVGVASQDVAAADRALSNAARLGLGTVL
jgi:ornithine cyclodeaminase